MKKSDIDVILSKARPVEGFEDYLITEHGDVYKRGTIYALKKYELGDGKLRVSLSTPGGSKTFFVHCLVAVAFLGHSKEPIEFKDKNKHNTHYTNLQYRQKKPLHLASRTNYALLENILVVLDDVFEYEGNHKTPFDDTELMDRLKKAYADGCTKLMKQPNNQTRSLKPSHLELVQ